MDLINPDKELQDYIEESINPKDSLLNDLNRYTFLKVHQPRMISGPVQAKFLELISKMISPEYILEVGTFTGFSAIALARGLREGGRLITIEINDELRANTIKYFEKAGLAEKIELINGDALTVIPELNIQFDLVFIDGEKEDYEQCYEKCLEKTNSGGFILVDNVLWSGKVLDLKNKSDKACRAIKQFNKKVASDPRVESMILPLRDGVSIIRKL